MTETIPCCPECGNASVKNLAREPDAEIYCYDCGDSFAEVDERRRRGPATRANRDTVAAQLVEADPDVLSSGGGAGEPEQQRPDAG